MDNNLLIFKPSHELEHEQNLLDFIKFAVKLPPINDKLDYESNYWSGVANFNIFGVSNHDRDPNHLLHESLLPFAKAYIAYGSKTKAAILSRVYAMRALHAACVPVYGFIDITKLSASDLDKAAQKAREALSQGAAYNAGRGLSLLLKFLIAKKMVKPFVWRNPIKKAKEMHTTDQETELARQKKMPDENALMALAEIATAKDEDLSPRDIITTSTMTLLLSVPARGSEVFYLRADCFHCETMKAQRAEDLGLSKEDIKALLPENEGNPSIDLDDKITLKGIKWFSGKGYGFENKWLPTVMYDAVTTAVERLRELSAEARAYARLLEETEDFPRHKLCPDVSEDQLLTSIEVALALGLDVHALGTSDPRYSTIRSFLRSRKISEKQYTYTLRELNSFIRKRLPEGFPYVRYRTGEGKVKLKWSEALYAGFENQLNIQKPTCYAELAMATINTLNEDLAPTKKKDRTTGKLLTNTLSIFQRWGFGAKSMTSHQLRHMLDTMAAVNGMDGELRAKWAQRSDPKHNRYYNHTTPEEYGHDFIEGRESQLADSEPATKIQVQVAVPRTIQELNTKASLTVHSTEFGICIQSYLSEPCTKYRDCINCGENVCIKGDDGKCERIRQRLSREKKLLKKDQKAVDDGVAGAEQWYLRRKLTTERCEELLKMMDNPDVEDGALIKLDIPDTTLLDRAMDANGRKRLPEITNFKRVANVSVNSLLGKSQVAPSSDEDTFDDLDDLEYMLEDQ